MQVDVTCFSSSCIWFAKGGLSGSVRKKWMDGPTYKNYLIVLLCALAHGPTLTNKILKKKKI